MRKNMELMWSLHAWQLALVPSSLGRGLVLTSWHVLPLRPFLCRDNASARQEIGNHAHADSPPWSNCNVLVDRPTMELESLMVSYMQGVFVSRILT